MNLHLKNFLLDFFYFKSTVISISSYKVEAAFFFCMKVFKKKNIETVFLYVYVNAFNNHTPVLPKIS